MSIGFVRRQPDGASVWLHATPDPSASARVRDVRWGDVLNIEDETPDGWTRIRWGDERYFIPTAEIVAERPLELVFVDVGQGDGCIVVPPEAGHRERILVIDAGERGHMFGMLSWRFGKLMRDFRFHAAVITHPDRDHYQGFRPLFDHPHVHFDRVYHNGLAERSGHAPLGPTDASGRYLTDLAVTRADLAAIYAADGPNAGKHYGRLMRAALGSGRVDDLVMLSTATAHDEGGRAWLPQFAPSDGRACTIEVLGPVPEPDADGRLRLRWFGSFIGSRAKDEAKTKNGHSVMLRLQVGGLRVLLGGDLNRPAEAYLLRHYSGIDPDAPLHDAVTAARHRLGADVLKSCHHGTSDVTDEFLQAVFPFAYIVSSGDEESHAHPRPDLLGRLGKHGRGEAPLILCTELLRSTRERGIPADFVRLRLLDEIIDDPSTPPAQKQAARGERVLLQQRIERRNVGVYGSVTVRTDGTHVEISFLLERPRGKQRWQIYRMMVGADGQRSGDFAP